MSTPVAAVLMYHRIAVEDLDPWGLCVTPAHFDMQMAMLKDSGLVRPLDAVVTDRDWTGRAVVLTLDDGFADTVSHAQPVVDRHDLPLTAYVMTAGFDGVRSCWWDVLAELLLRPGDLPPTTPPWVVQTGLGPLVEEAAHHTAAAAVRHLGWRASTPPPTARHRLYLALWERLIELAPADLTATLDVLRGWLGRGGTPAARLLTADEVGQLAGDPRITIGGHTHHHPSLPSLGRHAQRWEIAHSIERLQSVTGRPVTHFAYPYGRVDGAVVDAVRAAGLSSAVTTQSGLATPSSDAHLLPRYPVPDVAGPGFEAWLEAVFDLGP